MAKKFRHPRTEEDVQRLEAAGLWRAQARTKNIGGSNEKITLEVILRIHKIFFEEARLEIAGRFRKDGEDIKKLNSIEPPPGRVVGEYMYTFWRDFDARLSKIPPRPRKTVGKSRRHALGEWNRNILDLAAWAQYQITWIHPFCEGNGRMARLMTNLVLHRHHIYPSDIKYEGENRKQYLDALSAIDRDQNYELLRNLIERGIIATYEKLLTAKKTAQRTAKRKK